MNYRKINITTTYYSMQFNQVPLWSPNYIKTKTYWKKYRDERQNTFLHCVIDHTKNN